MVQDGAPCYYIYELTLKGKTQTGLVGCCSIDDYMNGVVKKHELTREDKEQDRIHHVDVCDANTGPIYLACKYPQELLDPLTGGYAKQTSELLRKINSAFLIPAGQSPSVSFYFNQICYSMQEKPSNHHLKVRSDFLSLLIDAVNFLPKQETAPEMLDSASTLSIVPALEYIKQNYMISFSMDYLAELCGLSPTHFRRIFNLAMGRSPLEYLNTVRINKACYLLRSTENSILNISEDVGFHSISSFNRYFSRMIGMSPREYRCCDSQDERLQKAKIMKFNGWMEAER